jgi:hypothetical protein
MARLVGGVVARYCCSRLEAESCQNWTTSCGASDEVRLAVTTHPSRSRLSGAAAAAWEGSQGRGRHRGKAVRHMSAFTQEGSGGPADRTESSRHTPLSGEEVEQQIVGRLVFVRHVPMAACMHSQ